jgi:ATP-dependent protease HslVU (ClpYQ) peptidase subunit
MTCLVALERGGRVWVGSDSFLGTDDIRDNIDHPKWFRRSGVLIGYAGSLRAAQVVENFADFRKRERGEPELCYLVGVVALAFRKALNASRVRLSTTEFLLAYRGKAYVLQNDYSVVRSSHGYTAIGVGAELANGALSVLAENMDARDVVERALRAAERHSTKVGGRLHVTCV